MCAPSPPPDLERLRRAVSGAVFGPDDGEACEKRDSMAASYPREVLTGLRDVKRRSDPKGLIHSSHELGG
jgi:hypothetical protein